jgi:hypothetical protein
VYRKESLVVDSEQFDRLTRSVNFRLSRRGLGGLAAGALASLGLMATADAKKKKKKKKKPSPPPPPPPLPPGTNTSCQNLTTACGNTAVCVCSLDKASNQVCINDAQPPDGNSFNDQPCLTNANCGAGTVCDDLFHTGFCVTACAN